MYYNLIISKQNYFKTIKISYKIIRIVFKINSINQYFIIINCYFKQKLLSLFLIILFKIKHKNGEN